ncbi:MAG: CpaF family protein [Clostridia bacterium]|nr:CpaF family protein [Clostridia bacterium]
MTNETIYPAGAGRYAGASSVKGDGSGYVDFWELLEEVRDNVSRNYTGLLSDGSDDELLRSVIERSVSDCQKGVRGFSRDELCLRLFNEMARYSILTPFLESDDVEEINVNGWDDVAVTFRDGRVIKSPEHFRSPGHAEDIVRRLLQNSGMVLDGASPMAQGHLPGNNRVTALRYPLIDADRGVAVSVRILHNTQIGLDRIVSGGTATAEMVAFLRLLCRYGVSFVIAGATSSGKTTLLGAILGDMPDGKRIFTIESGARELSLVRRDGSGRVSNNVVHTISRPSENERQDVAQEDLVVASLRFNPDIVCVGEMRDVECYAAVEAALTGHTVVSTVHSGPGEAAHTRIALLCQKKFGIDFNISMLQAAEAFPVVVYCGRHEDNRRRVMDITECVADYGNSRRVYRTLYKYVDGAFTSPFPASPDLLARLKEHGAPESALREFRFLR